MASLHLDFRPENFDEFIGNKAAVKSLKSVLDREEDIPHSFLFQGPSGCGKTTLARITKNILECHDQDFIEINAGNSRGIDTAREIIQTISYMPVAGDVRVILLDEVHQGTKDFQNALLKPLEDTPAHVYFLLCTTDPGKLLFTVRNRCSTFEVNKLSDDEIGELLAWVFDSEDIKMNDKAIDAIVEASEGCPRQALVILDQVIDLPDEEREEAVKLVALGDKQIIDLCRALKDRKSWPEIRDILEGIKDEPEMVRLTVLKYMNKVLLGGNGLGALIIECFKEPFYYGGRALLTLACWEAVDDEARKNVPF